MTTRIPEAPTFDYLDLVPRHRMRRLGTMPAQPVPLVDSATPPLERRWASQCWMGVCARCGRTLISATGAVPAGTVCHRACRG